MLEKHWNGFHFSPLRKIVEKITGLNNERKEKKAAKNV